MDILTILLILLIAIPSIMSGFIFMFYQKKIGIATQNNDIQLVKKLQKRKLIISNLITMPFLAAIVWLILIRS